MTDESSNVLPQDKLNYRLILQEHIDRCLKVRSIEYLEAFEKEVSDLKTAMSFNIVGVPFHDKISEAEDALNKWYNAKVELFKGEPSRNYYNPFYFHEKTEPWRFMKADAMFRHLIGLLAEHGALFESRKSIDKWREHEPPE